MKTFIPWAKPVFLGKEQDYLNQALDSTWISGGSFIEKFEKEFCRHIDSPYGITTKTKAIIADIFMVMYAIWIG